MAKASLIKLKSLWDVKALLLLFALLLVCGYPRVLLFLPGVNPESQPLTFLGFKVHADQISFPFNFRFPVEWVLGYIAFSFILLQKITAVS